MPTPNRNKAKNQNQPSRFSLIFLISIAILLISLISVKLYINHKLTTVPDNKVSILITIPKGAGIIDIVGIFNEYHLMEPSWFYTLYIKYYSKTENRYVNAGTHEIKPNVSYIDIIKGITTGDLIEDYKLTFPEGLNYKEIAAIIGKKTSIRPEDFINLCESQSLLNQHKVKASNFEGYLLPETYFCEQLKNSFGNCPNYFLEKNFRKLK